MACLKSLSKGPGAVVSILPLGLWYCRFFFFLILLMQAKCYLAPPRYQGAVKPILNLK